MAQNLRQCHSIQRPFVAVLSTTPAIIGHYLVSGGDWRAAFRSIPRELKRLFVTAYQSHLFNELDPGKSGQTQIVFVEGRGAGAGPSTPRPTPGGRFRSASRGVSWRSSWSAAAAMRPKGQDSM